MKKITLFLFAILFSISASAQITFNWEAQQISEGNNLKEMNMVDDTTTILVGYGNTFVVSPDLGDTWNSVPIIYPEYNFNDISINSSGTGYACSGDAKAIDNPSGAEEDVYADGVLLKTTDFGATWTLVDITKMGPDRSDQEELFPNSYGCYGRHFYSVEVLEDNTLYLGVEWYYRSSGYSDRLSYSGVLKSTNGVTWTSVTSDKYPAAIEATGTTMYFGGSNTLKKIDTGTGVLTDIYANLTTAASDETVYTFDFEIVSEDEVYVVTSTNGIYKTVDKGVSFQKLDAVTAPGGGFDMIVVNSNVMMVLGTEAKSLLTIDGGANWTACYPGTSCWDIGGIMNDSIVCLAKSSLYKMAVSDAIAGTPVWVEQPIHPGENLHKMHIVDENKAIVVGWGETVVSTSDKGINWTKNDLPELFVYGGLYDYSSVSTSGKASYACARRIYSPIFPTNDPATVYGHGLIYKSMDYWQTWELLDYRNVGTGTDQAFNPNADGCYGMSPTEIKCVNDSTVYMYVTWLDTVAGFDNKLTHSNVFKTEDGGVTWLPTLYDLGSKYVNSFSFLDKDHGFVVGSSMFFETMDGGTTYEDLYPPVSAANSDTAIYLKDIIYIDENEWYLPSSIDGIYKTNDGGASFEKFSGIGGTGGFMKLAENSFIALGQALKSKITWDGGASWTVCYPGSVVWEIAGELDGELIALAKSVLFKIPLEDLEPPSEETDILTFVLAEQTGDAVIDAVNHTISIEVAEGTDYTALSPTITLSEGASITPASGAAQDFTNPVGYTVTAEDMQTSLVWTVTVTVYAAPSREANILTFVLAEQTGDAVIDAVNNTVSIEVAVGTNVSALTPTITISDMATISPASGVAQDFTNPASYTVTAEDTEVTLVWTVTVTVFVPLSSDADILTFLLPEQTGNAVIDAVNHTVTIDVEDGTDPSALAPMITVSDGATIDPASLAPQDFTNPVSYTVTAEDGETSIVWTVTVNANVSIKKLTMDDIRMYPNPVIDKLHMENLEMVDNVSIISITGSSVLLINTPSPDVEIDMTSYEGGIYFIKLTDIDGGVSTKKFIKE